MRFEDLPENRKAQLFEYSVEGRCEAFHSNHSGRVVVVYSKTYDDCWAFCERMVRESYQRADFSVIKK